MSTPTASRLPVELKVGDSIRITQTIRGSDKTWSTRVEGIVESAQQESTGSWYAHSRDHKVALMRVRLRKQDGELVNLVVDPSTAIEKL